MACATFVAILAAGLVARATPTLTTLATFNGSNGSGPASDLVADAAGNLYGTTYSGGKGNWGTVFMVAAGTHALSDLASFNGGSDGFGPVAEPLIVDSAGNLYGTAQGGGSNNGHGTVFEVAVGTHSISTLATFNGTDRSYPSGVIADAAGNLYGTTQGGGLYNHGSVFEVAAGTHNLSTLASFNDGNGEVPEAHLIADRLGNFYGTTFSGGPGLSGTIFKMAAGTHALSTLAAFDINNSPGIGVLPKAPLIADAAGNLYGTAYYGGTSSNYGTVFELTAKTSTVSALVAFNGINGATPLAGLIMDAAGDLFGTTSSGGANNDGPVFEIVAGTHIATTLATFDGANGANPSYAGVFADAAGNLYGITASGGANNDGTVFEITNSGFVTSVPEPAAPFLIGLSSLGLLARRQRSWSP
jgi:uncharacterized repeat protein (TIGR03803 family)